jgi:dTDP-4-dehydrorhamnose reductase
MTWLIAGGTGQLGRALSIVLNERGINFIALGSKDFDICFANKTLDLIETLKPKVVINAAAWTDVDAAESNFEGAYAVNVQGTHNLVFATKSIGANYVQISTDYVFSGVSSRPWKEEDYREPTSVYGKTKLAAEDEVLTNYPENSYVFRTAWLYSEWGSNFVKTMLKLALQDNDQVRVVNDQFGQPTFAIDLANQIVESIIQKIPFGVYHATNSGQTSWCEFAKAIFKIIGEDSSRILPVGSNDFQRAAKRPPYSVLNNDSWEKTALQKMRDWETALSYAMPAIIAAVKAE